MKLTLTAQEARLYNKLSASENDLKLAEFCLKQIVKKRWHHGPFGGRGTTPEQQATYTCALVISYGRVFAQSKGMAALPSKLIKFSPTERQCHKEMLHLRNKVFAHIDASEFEATPLFETWVLHPPGTGEAAVLRWPPLRITQEQTTILRGMIEKLLMAIDMKMRELRRPYIEQLRTALAKKGRT